MCPGAYTGMGEYERRRTIRTPPTFALLAPLVNEGAGRLPLCVSPIDTAADSGYTGFQKEVIPMKKNDIVSWLKLLATPVLLMILVLILVIHPDSASVLAAQILGWVLLAAGVGFGVSAIAGHFGTVGKVLSAIGCFAVGAWLLRNPLMLAAALGRLVGILLAVRGIRDLLDASQRHMGLLSAVITLLLGVVLIALPMTTSRVVISLCGVLVIAVGAGILVDRVKIRRRLQEPDDPSIIDAL